jgi:hypothetical protein
MPLAIWPKPRHRRRLCVGTVNDRELLVNRSKTEPKAAVVGFGSSRTFESSRRSDHSSCLGVSVYVADCCSRFSDGTKPWNGTADGLHGQELHPCWPPCAPFVAVFGVSCGPRVFISSICGPVAACTAGRGCRVPSRHRKWDRRLSWGRRSVAGDPHGLRGWSKTLAPSGFVFDPRRVEVIRRDC